MSGHIPTAELEALQADARDRTAKFIYRLNVSMIIFMGALFVAGLIARAN